MPLLLKAPWGTHHSIETSQLPAGAEGAGPGGCRHMDTLVPGPHWTAAE